MTSFLYVEIYKSHTSLHIVLIEPSSEDTRELGRNWRQVPGRLLRNGLGEVADLPSRRDLGTWSACVFGLEFCLGIF